jgi:hypothetical protein
MTPKENDGWIDTKKLRDLLAKYIEPSNGPSSKVTKKEEDGLEAQRARALDKLINYDQST